jgi:uncharacterized protein YqeY
MDLKERITEDMKEALKRGEKIRLSALRLLLSVIKNAEIEKRGALTPEEIYSLIQKEARKWREAASDYRKVGNEKMARAEEEQVEVIEKYLPAQLSQEELEEMVEKVIKELKVSDLSGLGRVMQVLMPQVKGKADGRLVNEIVRKKLSA